MLQGFILAFSMYSNIPMPEITQTKKNQIYAIAFFPFVGLAIAAFTGIWLYFAPVFHFSRLFISIITMILPLFLSSNTLFFGFLQTASSLSNKKGRKKSATPDASFSITTIIFLLFSFGIWHELYPFVTSSTENDMIIICLIMLTFLMSRCLTGLSILSFKKAEETKLAALLSEPAQLKPAKNILLIIFFCCCLLQFLLSPKLSGILLGTGIIFFFYYRLHSLKHHGGITEENIGWFLHNCELLLLIMLLIICKYEY